MLELAPLRGGVGDTRRMNATAALMLPLQNANCLHRSAASFATRKTMNA